MRKDVTPGWAALRGVIRRDARGFSFVCALSAKKD
jgi:hypothetical protein